MSKESNLKTSTTIRRGLVHIALALSIAILVSLLPRDIVLMLLSLFTSVVIIADLSRLRFAKFHTWFQAVFKPFLRDYESSRLLGATYMLVGCLVSVTLFPREIAVLAISYLAVGDALATVVGERIGKHRLFKKNLEGVLACLFGCVAIGLGWYFSGLNASLVLVLAGAIVAAAAESLPLPIDDNLTIPVLSGLVMAAINFIIIVF